jgi:hypothetical protein
MHFGTEAWANRLPRNSEPDGTMRREFENGTVVYNPMGNKAVSVDPEDR